MENRTNHHKPDASRVRRLDQLARAAHAARQRAHARINRTPGGADDGGNGGNGGNGSDGGDGGYGGDGGPNGIEVLETR